MVLLFLAAGLACACTIGVIAGEVTVDGRPILWKNRDVTNTDQEYRYFETEPYSFVSNVYNGEDHRAWGGVNDVGFAIIDSDVYNLGGRGYSGPDDGEIMKWALQNCRTVDDFQAYLDSTNTERRRSCHNYACIDGEGGAAMFETAKDSYVRLDAIEEGGYVIRANFAMSGDMEGSLPGINRYNQAQTVIDRQPNIDFHFVLDSLASNIGTPWFSPYPLPYADPASSLPRGYVNTYLSVNRQQTSSAQIVIGKLPFEETISYPVLWGLFSQPILSMPFPLWPYTGGVHTALDGNTKSEMCHQANLFSLSAYDMPTGDYLNTYQAFSIREYFGNYKEEMFTLVEQRQNHIIDSINSPEYLRSLQDSITDFVEDKYRFGVALFVKEDIDKPDQLTVEIAPNPFNSNVSISLNPPVRRLDADIVDLRGRLIATLQRGTAREPIRQLSWAPQGCPSGVYFLRLHSEEYGLYSEKLLYVK